MTKRPLIRRTEPPFWRHGTRLQVLMNLGKTAALSRSYQFTKIDSSALVITNSHALPPSYTRCIHWGIWRERTSSDCTRQKYTYLRSSNNVGGQLNNCKVSLANRSLHFVISHPNWPPTSGRRLPSQLHRRHFLNLMPLRRNLRSLETKCSYSLFQINDLRSVMDILKSFILVHIRP